MKSISTIRIPIEQAQQDQLRTLFTSPGWSTLREIIAAHCTEAQVAFLDASLYDTEAASEIVGVSKAKAGRFNDALDVLDGIQEKMDEWFRISLEQRR